MERGSAAVWTLVDVFKRDLAVWQPKLLKTMGIGQIWPTYQLISHLRLSGWVLNNGGEKWRELGDVQVCEPGYCFFMCFPVCLLKGNHMYIYNYTCIQLYI